MTVDNLTLKWVSRICPDDGRLYDGYWVNAQYMPKELLPNTVVFDDFPDNTNGGVDYVWDGERLVYDPLTSEQLDAKRSGGELKC